MQDFLEQGVLEILEGWQQIGEIRFVSESGSVTGAINDPARD